MRLFSKKKQRETLIEQYDPESYGIIEIQRLFKTLYRKGGSSGIISLMMTSAIPQEGKSLLVGNLALVAAHANQRAVIIDADMRRPVQHSQFVVPPSPGLSDYLQKEAEFDQILHQTLNPNLTLIPCGTQVPSSGELLQLSTAEFKALLDQCNMHFDVVVVDVPPVIPVNDAEMIAPLVDAVVLTVMSGKTFREIIERALELLQKSGCNLLGLVLNNVEGVLPYYYEHRYYQYPLGRSAPFEDPSQNKAKKEKGKSEDEQ